MGQDSSKLNEVLEFSPECAILPVFPLHFSFIVPPLLNQAMRVYLCPVSTHLFPVSAHLLSFAVRLSTLGLPHFA